MNPESALGQTSKSGPVPLVPDADAPNIKRMPSDKGLGAVFHTVSQGERMFTVQIGEVRIEKAPNGQITLYVAGLQHGQEAAAWHTDDGQSLSFRLMDSSGPIGPPIMIGFYCHCRQSTALNERGVVEGIRFDQVTRIQIDAGQANGTPCDG